MNRTTAWRIGLVLLGLAAVVSVRAIIGPCSPRAPSEGPGVSHANLGARVLSVAAGPQGLWATRQPDVGVQLSELVELDPSTGRIKGSPVKLPALGGVAVGNDAVWVVTSRITAHPRSILHRVDPKTHRIVRSLRLGTGISGISVGESGLWVVNENGHRIDLVERSGRRIVKTLRFDDGPDLVLERAGRLWVGFEAGSVGAIHQIDPRTGRVTAITDGHLATVGAGAVWVNDGKSPDGSLFRLDPSTLRRLPGALRIDVGGATLGLTGDQVWVGTAFMYCNPSIPRGGRGLPVTSVGWYRLDPRTMKPMSRPVHVGLNPRPPVFASGALWILPDYPGNELIRLDLSVAAKV